MADKKVKPGKPLPVVDEVIITEEDIQTADLEAKKRSPLLWALLNAKPVIEEAE